VVRSGKSSDVLVALAKSLDGPKVVTEEELEEPWRGISTSASCALEAVGVETIEWSIELRPWGATMSGLNGDNKGTKELRALASPEFDYTNKRSVELGFTHPADRLTPLPPPASLPPVPSILILGTLPSEQELRSLAGVPDPPSTLPEDLPKAVVEARLQRQMDLAQAAAVEARGSRDIHLQVHTSQEAARWRKIVQQGDASALPSPFSLSGGEPACLAALNSYLRFHQSSNSQGKDAELYDVIRESMDTRDGQVGESFNQLFAASLLTGCVSIRWLVAEAIKYETDPKNNGYGVWFYDGPLNNNGYAMYRVYGFPTVRAVIAAAQRRDFLNSQLRRKFNLPSESTN